MQNICEMSISSEQKNENVKQHVFLQIGMSKRKGVAGRLRLQHQTWLGVTNVDKVLTNTNYYLLAYPIGIIKHRLYWFPIPYWRFPTGYIYIYISSPPSPRPCLSRPCGPGSLNAPNTLSINNVDVL